MHSCHSRYIDRVRSFTRVNGALFETSLAFLAHIHVKMDEVRRRKASVESKESQESSWSSVGTNAQTNQTKRKFSFAQQRQLEDKKGPCERQVHRAQDSLFSQSSGWTNFRGFFNLSILLLVISNGRVALENVIKYGILISPLQWISLLFKDISFWNWPNLALLIASNVTIITIFFSELIISYGWLGNRFAGVFYTFLIATHLSVPAIFTLLAPAQNPIFAVAAMSIFVIEALKMVSYVHVNYWARCAHEEMAQAKQKHKHLPGGEDGKCTALHPDLKDELSLYEMARLYPSTLTLSNLYYFMLAPTLCYELKFPRTHRIRKHFLLKRIVEVVFLGFLIAALIQQWMVPTVHNSMGPLSEMEFTRCLERLLKLAVPNHVIWLIFFYSTFHSLLNLIAEVLRFADREFYRDFWNAETVSYFWKTWNIPVHRWALRHIYMPMTRNNWSKSSAVFAVFFVSAFFHEYLVSVPLQMFRIWALMGMLAQVPLSFVTDRIVKGGRAGNVVVWLSLIVGQPLAILMYVHDWYIIHHPQLITENSIYEF
ncbi:unnamed protein product [Caenorhabditis auriculariae]|uniref:O-acyltransferase n=1 Tax=Caenorhabditis auriculariae TaxID=2777116 RepID=A0A8S1HHN2_9PELO|nr:unnamed protein product [Caenorhabditis auriculariae]